VRVFFNKELIDKKQKKGSRMVYKKLLVEFFCTQLALYGCAGVRM